MTSVSLNSALSGLQIAQQTIDTIAGNVSNASTPGYTRKILPQETQVIDGKAVGVLSSTLTRVVNTTLIGDVNRQTAVANYVTVQQAYFERLQDFQGAPNGQAALSDQVTQLANTFAQLSQSPSDPSLLSQTLTAAQLTASRINKYSNLLTGLRAQTENDIKTALTKVNGDISTIAKLNVEISSLASQGHSTADLEDQRDSAVNDLSQYMQVTTTRNGAILSVATPQGYVLADGQARTLYFHQSTMLPGSYYPGGGLSGIYLNSPTGTDIAQTNLGGQIGALLKMRDSTLPQYTAQIDEFAQKMSSRFEQEGLALFTDGSGNVPADVADPAPPTYVGFAALMQVNPDVLANPTLIKDGTAGGTEPAGSSEVINRISHYAFGNFKYQQASGNVDITSGTLAMALGITTNNNVTGTVNIATYAPDLSTLPGATFPGNFDITLGVLPPVTVTVNATDTAASVVSQINAAFGFNAASINGQGQLALNYNGDITLTEGGLGLSSLGLTAATTPMPDPSFQVTVGTGNPVTITIAATDTSVELLAKLNAVPGLTASVDGSGFLVMNPANGGALTATDIHGAALAAMGVTFSNVAFSAFRQSNLGPDGSLSTGLLAGSTLQNYISGLIADQSSAAGANQSLGAQEEAYLTTLQTRNANASGVNIDQEMAMLIQIQSAYAASAKMITATQAMFEDLFNAFNA